MPREKIEPINNTVSETSRKEFESWVMSDDSGLGEDEDGNISYTLLSRSDETGRYYHEEIEKAWIEWQGRHKEGFDDDNE